MKKLFALLSLIALAGCGGSQRSAGVGDLFDAWCSESASNCNNGGNGATTGGSGIGSPNTLSVTPEFVTLKVGRKQEFTATSQHKIGAAIVIWETVGGVGEIDQNGRFTATHPGEGEVRAYILQKNGKLTGTAKVFVKE